MEHFEIKKIQNYLNTKFATNLYEVKDDGKPD